MIGICIRGHSRVFIDKHLMPPGDVHEHSACDAIPDVHFVLQYNLHTCLATVAKLHGDSALLCIAWLQNVHVFMMKQLLLT